MKGKSIFAAIFLLLGLLFAGCGDTTNNYNCCDECEVQCDDNLTLNNLYYLEAAYKASDMNTSRITSYNVCYTKLLRLFLLKSASISQVFKSLTIVQTGTSNTKSGAFAQCIVLVQPDSQFLALNTFLCLYSLRVFRLVVVCK